MLQIVLEKNICQCHFSAPSARRFDYLVTSLRLLNFFYFINLFIFVKSMNGGIMSIRSKTKSQERVVFKKALHHRKEIKHVQ